MTARKMIKIIIVILNFFSFFSKTPPISTALIYHFLEFGFVAEFVVFGKSCHLFLRVEIFYDTFAFAT